MTKGNYSNVGHRGPVYKGLGAMNPCDNLRTIANPSNLARCVRICLTLVVVWECVRLTASQNVCGVGTTLAVRLVDRIYFVILKETFKNSRAFCHLVGPSDRLSAKHGNRGKDLNHIL
jgi:hypothetical protein